MNLVMQFRKVCNHPELFERRPCRSPFFFSPSYYYTGNLPVVFGQMKEIVSNAKNPIEFIYPKLLHDELFTAFSEKNSFFHRFSLWKAEYIHKQSLLSHNSFGFSRLMDLSPGLLSSFFRKDELFLAVFLMHFHLNLSRKYAVFGENMPIRNLLYINREILESPDYYYKEPKIQDYKSLLQIKTFFIPYKFNRLCVDLPKARAPPIEILCSSYSFSAELQRENSNRFGKAMLFGDKFMFYKKPIENSTILSLENASYLRYPFSSLFPYKEQKLIPDELFNENFSKIEIPDFNSLVADSTKLNYLDKMLSKLKKNNHRVLIFCQMTKMLDILEDYLMRKKYTFFRLDGSCNIADRRDMVSEFQNNHKIFAFLLSTRAGGLGVTLTAADTVIFYDNDWNPTMDAQATDRAHRIGQTKEVF